MAGSLSVITIFVIIKQVLPNWKRIGGWIFIAMIQLQIRSASKMKYV